MMRNKKLMLLVLILVTIISGGSIYGAVSHASSPDSLYTYNLRNNTGNVPNTATTNTTTLLQTTGNWSTDGTGTTFSGDTSSQQSASYAKPASGYTLDISADQSAGVGAEFIYRSPQNGTCFSDSPNITQIGKFATATSQLKLQLSNCGKSASQVLPECRIAGQSTPAKTFAVTGSTVLTDGFTYRLLCVKTPDPATGNASVTMTLQQVSPATQNEATVSTFSIPKTGTIQSMTYLSVANRYPLSSIAGNTDQFNGTVAAVSYCASTDVSTTTGCILSELGQDTSTPPSTSTDEIKYAFGNTADEVVFTWRGTETQLYYGIDATYGAVATGTPSAITPVDIAGPFMQAAISGLTPGQIYHYKIGENGTDETFRASPGATDSFKAVSIGDTIASTCRTYQAAMNQLVSDQQPYFVIHGGDMAIANECGVSAIHQFYTDIEPVTRRAAFMPVWGNHEYGQPTSNAPVGTPQDTLANYKGRSFIPNAQTVPGDTPSKTTNPGCGNEISSATNTCYGKDWGWFVAGRVLFISYPETWIGAITDWQSKVTPLMQQAQDNPDIDFIVTYGHRPAVSSTGWTPPNGYTSVFSTLGNTFSPSARADGKYVLNIAQHRHNLEAIPNYYGVTHLVNGGGGQGLINFQTPVAGSAFRAKHLGFTTLEYDAQTRSLTLSMVCGPDHTGQSSSCAAGSALYTQTFSRP